MSNLSKVLRKIFCQTKISTSKARVKDKIVSMEDKVKDPNSQKIQVIRLLRI